MKRTPEKVQVTGEVLTALLPRGCPFVNCTLGAQRQLHAQGCVTSPEPGQGKGGLRDMATHGSPATHTQPETCPLHPSLRGNGPGWAWNHFLVWGTSILSRQSPDQDTRNLPRAEEREPSFLSSH